MDTVTAGVIIFSSLIWALAAVLIAFTYFDYKMKVELAKIRDECEEADSDA